MPPGSRAEGMQVFPGLRLRMLAASFCFCVPGKYAAKQMCRRRPSFVWPGCLQAGQAGSLLVASYSTPLAWLCARSQGIGTCSSEAT